MPPHMISSWLHGGLVRVPVSLPYVAALVDGVKYMLPRDEPQPEDPPTGTAQPDATDDGEACRASR
jgi:hypothetical protein